MWVVGLVCRGLGCETGELRVSRRLRGVWRGGRVQLRVMGLLQGSVQGFRNE